MFFGNVLIMDAIADWTYEGGQTESKLGYSVSDAGDINQDGFHDVIVGQPLYDNGALTRVVFYYLMAIIQV